MENKTEEQSPNNCGNPKYERNPDKTNPCKRKGYLKTITEVNVNTFLPLASRQKNDMIGYGKFLKQFCSGYWIKQRYRQGLRNFSRKKMWPHFRSLP